MHDVRQWNVGVECKLDVHEVRRRDLLERERGLVRLVRCWQVVTLRGEHVHQLRRGQVLSCRCRLLLDMRGRLVFRRWIECMRDLPRRYLRRRGLTILYCVRRWQVLFGIFVVVHGLRRGHFLVYR